MVTRQQQQQQQQQQVQQRRGKARRRSGNDIPDVAAASTSTRRSSRLTLLLGILALTTSLLIALQVSRYNSRSSNSDGGGNWRRALMMKTGLERGKGLSGSSSSSSPDTNPELDAVKQRLGAIGKQFQQEFHKLKGLKGSTKPPPTSPKGKEQTQERTAAAAQMATVPGESVIDHKTTHNVDDLLHNAPHDPEKSDEEAREDQRIVLEDLDQDTLKAMFDALYSRE